MLKDRHIVLGVTGGIAVYKACDLVSRLGKQGAAVRVVLTENAAKFVPPLTFATLSGNPVNTDTFAPRFELEHIALSKWADAFVIAPATANCLAKLACGIADDLLSTTALAMTAPVLLAPAMNANMWRHPATQANLRTLLARCVRTVGPASGHLACGDDDIGRMSEPGEIVEALDQLLSPRRDFAGRRVLVTAGPTQEPLDPVRYLTNHSTGKMGCAIAKLAMLRGAEVTLVAGPLAVEPPPFVEVVNIKTAQDMYDAVTGRAQDMDFIFKAAAVADYTPAEVAADKVKKKDADLSIPLRRTRDILQYLGDHRRDGQVLCGFSMETRDLLENSAAKLEKKHVDMICANNLKVAGAGFGTDTNVISVITKAGVTELPLQSKDDAANAILDIAVSLSARHE